MPCQEHTLLYCKVDGCQLMFTVSRITWAELAPDPMGYCHQTNSFFYNLFLIQLEAFIVKKTWYKPLWSYKTSIWNKSPTFHRPISTIREWYLMMRRARISDTDSLSRTNVADLLRGIYHSSFFVMVQAL